MNLGPRVGQGKTAEVFIWGNKRVIKLFRSRSFDALLEAEWKLSKTVQELQLAVPEVYGVETVEGKQGIVYERVEGPTLTQRIAQKPWRITQLARQMAALHVSIGRQAGEGLPSQKQRLEYNITHVNQLTQEEKEAVIRYLQQLPEGRQACHGDFHPDNILLSPRGPVVIDWTTGSCGHPAADAARTELILNYAELPAAMPALSRFALSILRKVLLRQYLSAYRALSGYTMQELRQWTLPLAAARLIEGVSGEEEKQLLRLVKEQLSS